ELFGLAPYLFTASKDHWPKNIHGEKQSRKIRMSLETSFKRDLKILFKEIREFCEMIKNNKQL
ncbi:unnamed protein product, partial [marine sediment metagenome]